MCSSIQIPLNIGDVTQIDEVMRNNGEQVVADVIFEDMMRMPVTKETGLRLSSTAKGSVVIEDGKYVVVPYMGSSASGNFVKAEWLLPLDAHRCLQGSGPNTTAIASGHAFVNVSLPKALSARVRVVGVASAHSPALFVQPDSVPTTAGFAASASIVVELQYADRMVDATSDPRTKFNLSAVAGMFTVDAASKLLSAVGGGSVGKGIVRVSFGHEDVVAEVMVELAALDQLVVSATPYPEYSGSDKVDATRLSPISGSAPVKYQQAKLRLTMQLTNGYALELPSGSVQYFLDRQGSAVASEKGAVLTPTASGTAPLSHTLT